MGDTFQDSERLDHRLITITAITKRIYLTCYVAVQISHMKSRFMEPE